MIVSVCHRRSIAKNVHGIFVDALMSVGACVWLQSSECLNECTSRGTIWTPTPPEFEVWRGQVSRGRTVFERKNVPSLQLPSSAQLIIRSAHLLSSSAQLISSAHQLTSSAISLEIVPSPQLPSSAQLIIRSAHHFSSSAQFTSSAHLSSSANQLS